MNAISGNQELPLPNTLYTNGSVADSSLSGVNDRAIFNRRMSPTPRRKISRICCIGAGYVGGPTSAVIANKVPSLRVTVVDLNKHRIDAWNSDNLPIYEPDLVDTVLPARDGVRHGRPPNLFFTSEVDDAVASADLIFVSVNTPTKYIGLGAGRAIDLGFVESATRKIAEVAITDKIVVEKSTVPCRTAESIRDILSANGKPGVKFDVLSNPEFLAEGTAISDLVYPDRILIGSLSTADGIEAATALVDLYAHWVPRERIITMNLWSSELGKIAANALLAQRISSINSLSAICEATGAHIDEVSYAVGLDKRIGPWMLKSSVGFGGSCFKKDIYSLVYLAESLHLPEVAAYWKSVVDINEWQKDRFTKRIISSLYNTLINKKVAIFGFAYKKNTGDTRESAAISIANALIAERAKVAIYDPQVREEQIWNDLWRSSSNIQDTNECVEVCKNAYDACLDAHAVVIVTEWDEFKVDESYISSLQNGSRSKTPLATENDEAYANSRPGLLTNGVSQFTDERKENSRAIMQPSDNDGLSSPSEARPTVDWGRIAGIMCRPMFVFDGRNIVNARKLEQLGFRVECIGNASSGSMR